MQREPQRGRWQAQGSDIGGGGYSVPWAQQDAPTKQQGLTNLATLAGACQARQRDTRAGACATAKRWLSLLPADGVSAPFRPKPFYARPVTDSARNARIDLEIHAGTAFVG